MSTQDFSDIENMSDEDFMNMELPDFDFDSTPTEDFDEQDESDEGALAPESDEVDAEEPAEEQEEVADEEYSVDEAEEEQSDESTEEESEGAEEEDATPEEEEKTTVEEKDSLEELFKPFKANKRDMAVKTVEEARTLMKMGANYSKKMAAIKPLTRVGHMLEKYGLMDEEKLSYLIDLHNKNPQAIAKMISDSGIDPLDVNPEDGAEYRPTSHAPTDNEMNLDEVIRDISGTDSYQRTIDTVTKEWDRASSDDLATNPQELVHLNEQIGNGVFDLIIAEVDRQRAFNGLRGISDYAAYKKVGAELLERANVERQASHTSESTQSKSKPVNKKRVAIPKKRAATKNSADLLDLEAVGKMTDEEFEKHFNKKFI